VSGSGSWVSRSSLYARAGSVAGMRIDLHAHTTCSDGTKTPTELVSAAYEAGLDVVAITDHDTTAGWDEARRAVREGSEAGAFPNGLGIVPGIEISCRIRDVSIHMLGYLFDPANVELGHTLEEIRAGRVHRAERMVERCIELGAPITWKRVREIAAGVVGRPHIATALIEAGVVPDIDAAFGPEWIGHGGRAHVDKLDIDPVRAVELVKAAGGVTVFAHPVAWKRGPVVSDGDIAAFAAAGLDGIEMDHPDHDADGREHVRRLAKELGLLTTGSSDWHGSRKKTLLGAETTEPEVFAALCGAASGEVF
jgi:3',5'-nucleoside bisphosphate phosphatase